MSDALFDFEDFEPEPIYEGRAPLTFTTEYFHPDDLVEAHKWLCKTQGHFGSAVGRFHTWHYGITTGWVIPEYEAEHSLCMLTCCLSCFDYPSHDIDRSRPNGSSLRTCYCVQMNLNQAVCSACRWHHIAESESEVVEVWHDHAFPGWRDLPVCPLPFTGMGGDKKAVEWVKEHYPVEWQRPFAPVLTERKKYGTRHVPGRSPWGGFDMCGRVIEEASA